MRREVTHPKRVDSGGLCKVHLEQPNRETERTVGARRRGRGEAGSECLMDGRPPRAPERRGLRSQGSHQVSPETPPLPCTPTSPKQTLLWVPARLGDVLRCGQVPLSTRAHQPARRGPGPSGSLAPDSARRRGVHPNGLPPRIYHSAPTALAAARGQAARPRALLGPCPPAHAAYETQAEREAGAWEQPPRGPAGGCVPRSQVQAPPARRGFVSRSAERQPGW